MAPKRSSSASPTELDYYCVTSPEKPLTRLADGTLFPESGDFHVLVSDHEETTVVQVALEVRDGRPVVTNVGVRRLDVGGVHEDKALTPTFLRELDFGKIFGAAIEQGAFMGVGFKNPLRDKPIAISAASRATALARRRQPLSNDQLAQVVKIVKENKYNPRKQVASLLFLSERTASRRIAEAKKRGLFDEQPTSKGIDNG